MPPTAGRYLGAKLCEIFGLKHVVGLSITCEIEECVMLNARILAEHQQGEELATELKRYKLVPIEDEGGIEPGARD